MKTVRLSVTLMVFSLLCSMQAISQPAPYSYKMNGPTLPILDFTTTTSTITISDVFTITDFNVMVNIRHTHAADLKITLTAPGGTQYLLSQYNGQFGKNYENTIFDSSPGTSIPARSVDNASNTTAYFRGIYAPQTGTTLPSSGNPVGDWTLSVYDNAVGDQGTLESWALLFNSYGSYKDIRFGCDLNYNNWTVYPVPLIGDFSTLPSYMVHSYRLENNQAVGYPVYQNSRIATDVSIMLQHKDPLGNNTYTPYWYNTFTQASQGSISVPLDLGNTAGDHQYTVSMTARGILSVMNNDDAITRTLTVTPGSVGYDNGDWANGNTYNPPVGECDAMYFQSSSTQTLSSVDVWEGSQVEYDSPTSTSRNEVVLWDANGSTPTQKATTGPVAMPPQGQKWVTYRFGQTGVTINSGNYIAGICVDAIDPNVGGFASVVGLGVDLRTSPFAPQSFFNAYMGQGVQLWMSGATWNEEIFRDYATKMIRPNFVNLIDIGVTSIVTTVSPTSVTAVVSYGIYAQSQNPNVVAQGTVTITDANKNVVASQEQRVFLVNQPPYMTNATATFTFTGLAKGPYTITAAINNGNDENLINNTYSRTFTVVFAPVTVVIDGSTSAAKMDQIASSYADQGMSVNFVKVSSFAFPSEGYVVWAASMTPEQAAAARAFAAKGNTFAMLTEPNSDALNNTFALFATQKETESMNARLHVPSDIVIPTRDYSMLSSLQTVPMINATPDQEENAAKRLGGFIEYLNNMKFGNDNLNRINSKGRVYDHSEDMRIVAKRIGSVTVSELAMTKTSDAVLAVSQISNPSNFELAQNYPNPFNPSTTVAYNLPSAAQVSVRVYDLLGREVAVLANASQAAGKYLVAWDGRSSQGGTVASGMYLYRMEATPLNGSASFSTTKKMMFAK